ncbi:MAG: branched-chain amino acid ABC transporter permease [Candidatus Methanomethylicia archaeon]
MDGLFLSLFLHFIFLSSTYALMAYGMALICGIMRIINVLHAGFIMFGGYFAYALFIYYGIDPLISSIILIPVAFILGFSIHRALLARLAKTSIQMTLLLLFALWIIAQNLSLLLFTADPRMIASRLPYAFEINLGGVNVSFQRIVLLCAFTLVSFLTYMLLNRTMLGKAIRGTSQDEEAASYCGVNTELIKDVAFGIGTVLASIFGALATILYPIDPFFGTVFQFKVFVITVLAGMENVIGVFIASMMISAIESIAGFYVKFGLLDIVTYVVFLVVLIIWPQGLFRR